MSSGTGERGRAVVVTGASRGIGLETARRFAASGARVVLAARSEERISREVDNLRSNGAQVWARRLDVTSPDQCIDLARWAAEELGGIDVCVLSAGVGHWTPTVEMSDDQWHETMAVNVTGVFLMTRAALPDMVARRRGHLIYLSSVIGQRGVPNMSAYAASKAAVSAFAQSVGREVRHAGVKVTVLSPGTTSTTMRDHQTRRPQTPDIMDPELQLTPGDVADAALWAASTAPSAYPTTVVVEPKGI